MRAVYKKSDGTYCDSEQSYVKPPDDKGIIDGPNVIGRFGGKVSDYIVIECPDRPWLKKYLGGKLVDDTEKIAAMETARAEAETQRQTIEALRDKIKAGSATLKEVQEFLGRTF